MWCEDMPCSRRNVAPQKEKTNATPIGEKGGDNKRLKLVSLFSLSLPPSRRMHSSGKLGPRGTMDNRPLQTQIIEPHRAGPDDGVVCHGALT